MFRPHTPDRRPPARRGAILLVVMTMLALFAVIGLSFVLYSETAATSARINRDAQDQPGDPDPSAAVQQFLRDLIFDVPDHTADAMSALRGHSLARARFGWNGRAAGTDASDTRPVKLVPYNGVGTFHEQLTLPGVTGQINRPQIVNTAYQPGSGFVIDPERTSFRTEADFRTDPTAGYTAAHSYVSKAAGYTYPDTKDFYLGMVRPDTGEVIAQSFHRPWLFNPGTTDVGKRLAPPNTPGAGANADWLTKTGRLKMVRPRPVDQLAPADFVAAGITLSSYPPTDADIASNSSAIATLIQQKIQNGEILPYPMPNPDGTYTGDVQNWRFHQGPQKNDSVWLYLNAPVKTWRGKLYTTLVAPLVQDLNGRVNLSVAGNLKANSGGVFGTASNMGYGPWEINPRHLGDPTNATLDRELQNILLARYGLPLTPLPPAAVTPPTATTPPADPYKLGMAAPQPSFAATNRGHAAPHYSRVDWDGLGNTTPGDPMQLPVANTYSPFPTYPATRFCLDTPSFQLTECQNHPAQFQPFGFPRGPVSGIAHLFGFPDVKALGGRYSSDLRPQTLLAELPGLAPTNLGSPAPSAEAARVRNMVTTFSTTLARAEVQLPITGSLQSLRLGPIDINRPLLPYHDPGTGATPSPPVFGQAAGTPGGIHQPVASGDGPFERARLDRHRLARDIFLRLVGVATFPATFPAELQNQPVANSFPIDPATGYLQIPQGVDPKKDFLRSLAQIAANMVDYVDPDDVMTTFVWAPVDPRIPDPFAVANNFSPESFNAGVMVFGTELPRLVVNEAYGALMNHSSEMPEPPGPMPKKAKLTFQKKFWVELHNPLSPPDEPIDPSRTRGGDPMLSERGSARLQTLNSGGPVYSLMIAEVPVGQTFLTAMTAGGQGANVTGDPTKALMAVPVNVLDFSSDGGQPSARSGMPPWDAANPNPAYYYVNPANGQPQGTINNGYFVVGPPADPGAEWASYFPTDATPGSMEDSIAVNTRPSRTSGQGGGDANQLTVERAFTDPNKNTEEWRNEEKDRTHAVVLRRLANPYLPPNYPGMPGTTGYQPAQPFNPYVTVDVLDGVKVADRVKYNKDGPAPASTTENLPSVIKRHPYGGAAVELQGGGVPQTFHRANDANPTQLDNTAGFAWLTHLDREVVNSLELLHVSQHPPHLLTQAFGANPSGTAWEYNRHTLARTAQSPFPAGMAGMAGILDYTAPSGLHRLFDVVTARPHATGMPVGGLEAGKVNINTVWDRRVFQALLDYRQNAGGNLFNTAPAAPVFDLDLWQKIVTSRTPNHPDRGAGHQPTKPLIGPTFDELPPLTTVDPEHTSSTPPLPPNRPFKALGGAAFGPAQPIVGTNGAATLSHGATLGDTLLRPLEGSSPSVSLVVNPNQTHDYARQEPLRKMLNNLTTTSDSFLVLFTVGFFEVRDIDLTNPAFPRPRLGRELFKEVPADMRSQYLAVVDRAGLTIRDVDPAGRVSPGDQPWFTNLTADAAAGTNTIAVTATLENPAQPHNNDTNPVVVLHDGARFPVRPAVGTKPATRLRLGFGDWGDGTTAGAQTAENGDGEWVTVTGVTVPATLTGQVALTVATDAAGGMLRRSHPAGSPVSNAILGNPGPQPGFDFASPAYRHLVPYITRLGP